MFKKIYSNRKGLITFLLLIVAFMLVKNAITQISMYNSFYVDHSIGNRITKALSFITIVDDERNYMPGASDATSEKQDIALGNSPYELTDVKHSIAVTLSEDFYYLQGIRSQCIIDLPIIDPSMKDETDNTIKLCYMMQKFIADYSPEHPGDLDDYREMMRFLRELYCILVDEKGTYVTDPDNLGYSVKDPRPFGGTYIGKDGIGHFSTYANTTQAIRERMHRFNIVVEGVSKERFYRLVNKYIS